MRTNSEKRHSLTTEPGDYLLRYVTERSDKVTSSHGGNHMALCLLPGHNEKTPSLKIDTDLALFHCFGCGRGGSIVDLVMACEGLSFPEACNRIAGMFGEAALPERIQARRNAFRANKGGAQR
jgi:DNA primase